MTDSTQEWREGDLVEAVKGEERHVARVRPGRAVPRPVFGEGGTSLQWFTDNGFTLTLVERAPEPLPTEPGVYFESETRPTKTTMWTLTEDGRWVSHAGPEYDGRVSEFGPLTRLEPVPVTEAATAKKLLKRLAELDGSKAQGGRVCSAIRESIKILEVEFGVTND